MSDQTIYERFFWFDERVKAKTYPNAAKLAERFEISTKTAQRAIEFMRDRLLTPPDNNQIIFCDMPWSFWGVIEKPG